MMDADRTQPHSGVPVVHASVVFGWVIVDCPSPLELKGGPAQPGLKCGFGRSRSAFDLDELIKQELIFLVNDCLPLLLLLPLRGHLA